MTNEEAKQLRPGDRVLVEAEVEIATTGEPPHPHISHIGNVAVKSAHDGSNSLVFFTVAPSAIREKLAPPRRKFRKGDIVRTHRGYVFFAVEDENEDGAVSVEQSEDLVADHFANAENLTLLVAVEKREDRSAAAEGSGVTREGGEA